MTSDRDDEAALDRLRGEWLHVLESSAGAADNDLGRWCRELERLHAEYDDMLRRGKWRGGATDLLTIIGCARRETYHSAILAWLLDPQGSHGLGTAFLEAILAKWPDVAPASVHRARVECEVSRFDTRADIVVSLEDTTLIIENKVDAGEMPRQCDRLYEHFGRDPGAVFVFLTPTGRRPVTATGDAAAAFRVMSYLDVVGALRALVTSAATGVSAGHSTAANYLTTLERELR